MQRFLQLSAVVLTLFLMPLNRSLGQTYCASNGTAPWEQWIGDVRLTDNQSNGAPVIFQNASQKEGYGNFTSQIVPLRTGQPYSVVLSPAFSWQGDPRNQNFTWQVWIDYNQNNIFESIERVINAPVSVGSPNIISFDMPTTAILGRTRLRISMREGAQSPTVDPCATFQRGEVEDYSVNITGGGTIGPADLTLSNLNISNSPVQPITFLNYSLDFRNLGTANAGAFITRVYISEDNILDDSDLESFPNISNNSLLAGAVQNYQGRVGIPGYRADGTYYLFLKIDANNSVTESNENNNVISAPFVIRRNNLVVTNVTGATQVAAGSTVPFSVTIQNAGSVASFPDSVGIVYWKPPAFGLGVFSSNYSPTRIPVPSIAAGQSLVVNGNFVMPNRLKTDYLSERFVREPYFIPSSVADIVNFTAPSSVPLGFLYPLQPLAQADLQVSTTQLTATWDSINPNMELRVTLRNNGLQAVRNVKVTIHRANAVNNTVYFSGTGIDNFVKLTGTGTLTREFSITGSREENGDYYNLWNLAEIPANTTLEATFRCQAVGYQGVPQYERDFAVPNWYRTLTIRSWVQYADARDVNRANDSSAVLSYPNVLANPNPTPNNLSVTNVTGAMQVASGSTVPFVITVRNNAATTSVSDSISLVLWRPPFPGAGLYNYPYSPTKIAVPSIAAGQSIVVNGNFIMPSRLRTDILSIDNVREPYFISTSAATTANTGAPLSAPLGFSYPLQPLAQADLQVTTTQLNATWDSINPFINLRVTLRNNGPDAVRNVAVNVYRTDIVSSVVGVLRSDLDNFTKQTGIGTLTNEFLSAGVARAELGYFFNLWNIPEIAAGATIEATFRGQVVGYLSVPQSEANVANPTWYRTFQVKSNLQYAEARDVNRINDTAAVLSYPNVYANPNPTPQPDLTVSNLSLTTPPPVSAGSVVNYRFNLSNIGTAAATGIFNVKAYISRDNVLSADDIQDGIVPTGNFAIGQVVSNVGGASTIPSNLAAGNYYLILKIDGDNQIAESNENNNVIALATPFAVTNGGAPNCLNVFSLYGFVDPLCSRNSLGYNSSQGGTLYQYTNNIADGFHLKTYLGSTNNANLFMRNGSSTRPAGSRFTNCSGNWVYFTAEGGNINSTGARSLDELLSNVNVRVLPYGNAQNLDSLAIEIDSSFGNLPRRLISAFKSQQCNTCSATDNTAPTFTNCPTPVLNYPMTEAQTASLITTQNLVTSTDNCDGNFSYESLTFIQLFFNSSYNISLIRYDSAGRKGVCNFTLRTPNAPCAGVNAPTITNCPTNISLQAATGQTCVNANWTVPTATGLRVNLTSNFQPNTCFSIGTTVVTYTATDSCGRTATCTFNVVVTGGGATCLNQFSLESFNAQNCIRGSNTTPWEFGTLSQYTNNIADGFMLSVNVFGTNTRLFMRNGTSIRPSGSRFSNCAANWIYFVAEGGRIRNDARSTNIEVPSLPIRVRTFGNAQNPDSIIVELDSSTTETPISLVSLQKTQRCNPCYATDRTAPVIQNCPASGIVNYDLASSSSQFTRSLLAELNITSSDNCPIDITNPLEFMYPNVYFANWRTSQAFSLVRYDSAGNRARCNFTVRFGNPPCAFFTSPPVIANCPANISLQAATGQTCATATWLAPTATSSGGVIPVSSLTSNFQSGACFPIGTTVVTYTATDSCGRTATCAFNVVVTGGGSGSTCTNNLLQNAGFESGLTSWDGNGVVTTTANTGTRAVRICNSGDVIYQQLSAVGGRVYQLNQMSVRVDANTNGLVGIKFMNGSFTPILDVAAIGINQNQSSYTQLFNTPYSITAPASAAYVQVYVTKSNGAGCIYVDDVCFSQNTGGGGNPCQTTAAPVISGCPTNISLQATTGQTCANATWSAPTATGLRVNLTSNFQSGACFPIGITTVNYTATDSCGRTATCSFTVNVTNNTGGGADLGLSITPNPATYRPYSTNVVSVTARNNSTTTMTNVRIEFPFPANTVNGGSAVASFGTWNEWCAGGRQCFEWTIPTLAANSSATLAVPLFVLNPTGNITVTTRLLASTPTDGNAANNVATAIITPVAGAAQNIASAERFLSPTQAVPVVLQKLFPNPVEADLVVDLESIEKRDVQFFIYDVAGKQVETYTQTVEKGKNRIVFDVFRLPQGTYYLKSNAGSGLASALRFIKF